MNEQLAPILNYVP